MFLCNIREKLLVLTFKWVHKVVIVFLAIQSLLPYAHSQKWHEVLFIMALIYDSFWDPGF